MTENQKIKGCILPWLHIFGAITGEYRACCHVEFLDDESTVLGNHKQTLDEVWNGESYRNIRQRFLKGDIPDGCKKVCYDREVHGDSISNRQQVNKRFKKKAYLQDLTNDDGSLPNKPSYLDLRFGNLCNFKCRTCGPFASTSWYTDWPDNKLSSVVDYYSDNEAVWSSFPEYLSELEDVYFAGGEPFVQEGHYKLLLKLIELDYAKNINLQYNTNLSYTKFKKYDLEDIWSNFKSVDLWPSIDGFGTRAEYTRKGLSWKTFEANAIYFKKHISTFSCVISLYSITSMPDLILWCKKNGFNYYGNILNGPEMFNLKCLPKDCKKQIVELYKRFVIKNKNILSPHDLSQIKSWLSYMNGGDDSHLLPQFKREQTRLDLLRNESFESTYPEYASWYKNI